MSNRGIRFVAALAVSSLLVPTACSGNGGGDSSPSSSGGTAAATASSSPTENTYSDNGVSFRYPADWRQSILSGATVSGGTQLWDVAVGMSKINFVSVLAYTINMPITRKNIDRQKASIAREIANLFTRAGGSIQSGPTHETMAGLPALGFTGTALDPSGHLLNNRLVLAFDRMTEYFVSCQYDFSHKPEILAGCDQIVSTFSLG